MITAKRARPCPLCGEDKPKTEFAKGGFDFARCQACSHLYIAEVLADNYHFEEEYYDDKDIEEVEAYDPRSVRGERVSRFADDLQKAFGPRKDLKILDVGCGKGWHLGMMKSLGYTDVRGVEVNKKVAQAATRLRGVPVDQGFLEEIRYPDGTYDAVFMDQVVEHLEDPRTLLKEALRILKPGGLIWVSVPNIDAWHIRLWLKENHRHFEGSKHLNYYTCATLSRLLDGVGFRVSHVKTFIEEATVQRVKGVLTSPTDFESTAVRKQKAASGAKKSMPAMKPGKAKSALHLAFAPVNALLILLTRSLNAGAYIEIVGRKAS